jgi:hypothetical protein
VLKHTYTHANVCGSSVLRLSVAIPRLALVLAGCAATSSVFAPTDTTGLHLKSAVAVSRLPVATVPKVTLEDVDDAAHLFDVDQIVPFVDEVIDEDQDFTAPDNHYEV